MNADTLRNLYLASVDADNAWQAELVRRFGKNAGDVRYTEKGQSGPILGPLFQNARRAADAWHEAMNQ